MAINIISEQYNGYNSLIANVGDWVEGELVFKTTTEHPFTDTNILSYRDATGNNGGAYELEIQQGSWAGEGFSAGDEIEIEVRTVKHTITGGVVNTDGTQSGGTFSAYFPIQIKYKATILYLDANPLKVGIDGPLELVNPAQAPYYIIPFATPQTTIELPGSSYTIKDFYSAGVHLNYQYDIGSIRKTSRPEEIELFFNLAQNGSSNQASVVNGQVNRFKHILPTTSNFSPVQMTQLNNPSGSYFKEVYIEQTQDLGATTEWKINYKFMQWGFVEDGYTEPDYYDASDCLAPIGLIKVFANAGNQNGVLEKETSNNIGNTGGFDESLNGGANLFTKQSMEFYDSFGNVIDGIDYSGECTFKAVVATPNGQTPGSLHGCNLGLVYRPDDSDVYSNSTFSLGSTLMVNAPETLFLIDGSVDSNTYTGETSPANNNAGFDFSDISMTNVGTTVEIEGKITPTSGANSYFSAIPDGSRKMTMWLSIGNGQSDLVLNRPNIDDKVSLILFDGDTIDAPIVGVQIPNVLTEELYDHGGNLITDNSVDNTTTEDDVLYVSDFLLPIDTAYSGMRMKISAYNSTNDDEFTLENYYISFDGLVVQNDIIQVNETISRNFNLPPSTDRNHISIFRKDSLDTAGYAGYQLQYGFLNDWRYWLSQSNVNSDFYNISEPNNGYNKNWQNFYSGDWLLRLSYFTELNGVEDYNYYPFKIRPYEDDIDVTTSTTFTVLSSGVNPTQLVDNELIQIQVVFTWNQLFADEWVEFTVEDYESGNRWVISSYLDQGNVSSNPLKPISGNTKIDVSGTGTNVLTCKANIDTSIISSNTVSLSYRVYSSPNDSGGVDVLTAKFKEDGTIKVKEDGTTKILE